MTTTTCETVRELLVDYSDNELDVATCGIVRDHVQMCSACRDELNDLQRSLEHARRIWQHSDEASPSLDVRSLKVKRRTRNALTLAAATSAAVIGIWLVGRPMLWKILAPTERDVVQQNTQLDRAHSEPELSNIASMIAQEAQSARLAASSQLLAERPSLAEYRRHADTYLATTYKNSPAGAQARQRLEFPSSSDTGALP